MKRKIEKLLWNITPHVHNLKTIIYINWFGYEWIIRKQNGGGEAMVETICNTIIIVAFIIAGAYMMTH